MGAPKQKWTAEEEAALKAGVGKHGAGKWRTILTDPEFSATLRIRSNVDLKDKWRNINVTAIWGSRHKAKLALKRNLTPSKTGNNHTMALDVVDQCNEENADAKPLAVSGGTFPNTKEQLSRLDNLILKSIIKLKEPKGSDKTSIAAYIEDQYQSPPNLGKLLSTKLKQMVASGKLMKVKHKYRIATNSTTSQKRRCSSLSPQEGRPKDSSKAEKSQKTDVNIISKSQVDADLSKIKDVTAEEAAEAAAEAAAKAVAEAEVAIAEAEAAAREADAAEAEAEAARVFAKAAMKALKRRTLYFW